ncbi:MAG: hypothetical protein C0505_19075 [Leptothrix sp. (in: Bacteria)]|nr:hypothetical protein [Leptothrix sp. (in: b-proteobacteria)]
MAAPAWAQVVPPPPRINDLPAVRPAAPATAAASAASAAGATSSARSAAAAGGGRVSIFEDDKVRIEETRDARGQVQRITVHSKTGGKSYEIIVPPGGQDASQQRGAAGQRAWSVFAF